MALDDDDMLDCFLNWQEVDEMHPFPLDYGVIANAQAIDARLQQRLQDDPQHYVRNQLTETANVICHIRHNNEPWRICIPDALLQPTVQWYHQALNHLGMNRLHDTIRLHLYHPRLRATVETLVGSCAVCQQAKLPGRGYGELPERNANIAPWSEVALDLIGPWTLKVNDETLTFVALTIIDTVTNYCELIRLHNKTAAHTALQFENAWLSRYPRPIHAIVDQGPEFMGQQFGLLLQRYGIAQHTTTVANPQANALCERLHQTVANSLRVLQHVHQPINIEQAALIVDTALQTAAYSARSAIHGTLKISPGALVFHRDMLLDIPIIADLQLLQQNRQALIDERLLRDNRRRISHDYQPGNQVLLLTYKPDKLQPRATGPYPIETVHTNGTVTIRLSPWITERKNIRHVRPFRQPEPQ